MSYIFFIALGFLNGSILYSYYIPKIIKKIDVTAVSRDGNPGTSNAMKYAGVPVGVCCLLTDIFKGLIPVYIAAKSLDTQNLLFSFVIAAPVAGHAFSVFRHFRGGKAIATSFGVLLGLIAETLIVIALVGFYILYSVAFVINPHERRSVVSYFSLMCFCGAALLFGFPLSYFLGCCGISMIAIYKNSDYKHKQADCAEQKASE